ncbi:transmembrane protein 192-like [Amphibalanus amphitrite]|uniref:transmembrane protein 192-like n=1 Tax=Amphibalanus amphitrite TaxID=1232801 RepID=UPI001C919873|nr:transmembrane protein 192-like [Amphibalanus amphitrite]XP_043208008.1 transmembrane protein 192-like [Amphibalanus amphitrite]
MALNAARVAGRRRTSATQDDQQQLVSSIGSAASMVRSDAESLVASEDVPSRHSVVSDLEPMFRPVRVTPYIAVHMTILVGLLLAVLLLPFPFFCKYDNCPLQTYTLQTLLHIAAWLASAILHYILHRLHFDSYISGYSEFHRASRLHRKFPFVVYSVGNSLLLGLCLVLREAPPSPGPEPDPYPSRWPLSAFHYVQLLVAFEFIALMPVLIHYLRIVVRFNAARAPPDVADEDPELRPTTRAGRRSAKDDAAYTAHLLRRQADCIQALRAHNTMLGRKILEQHARLTTGATGAV